MEREAIRANAVVFISSFCTLVIELVAGRILAPYIGVSLYTWTSIIGVVLAGISVGAYLGGILADRRPTHATLGYLLFFSGIGAFSIPPLTNLVGGLDVKTSLMLRTLIFTAIIFFAPSCLLGMISPVVVKLTLQNLNRTGNVVGKIYAFSTLGSILGTFATGFFLISWMGTRLIIFSMGAILIVSGAVFGGFLRRRKLNALLFALCIGLAWSVYGHAFIPSQNAETYFYKESNYYTIKVQKKESSEDDSRLEALVLDHLIHSYTDLEDPLHLEYEYIKLYEELLTRHLRTRESFSALFIGGGGYTFPRYLEARFPEAKIDVVEIDPEVTRVAEKYLGLSREGRIRTYNQDARWFAMNCREAGQYDFIFGDAFNDLTIPYHLTTVEFSALMSKLLKPDGLLLANIIDSFKKGLFLPSYIRTLEKVFGEGKVHLVTTNSEYNDMGTGTYIVVAGPLESGREAPTDGPPGDPSADRKLTHIMPPHILRAYLVERQPLVLTDDYVPVDNLLAPVFEERFGYRR
jgi:predicted membrane-bound spermidine synthase